MTLPARTRKSNGRVTRRPDSFYAEWRARSGFRFALREEAPTPPEQLLQAVWFHQRLRREDLVTLDGRAVRVLHPGFWNREAGPDFREAVLQLGGDLPRVGDVEVDLAPGNWRAHKHDSNPAFRNVLLHVVWEGEEAPGIPALALKPFLDAPLLELATWLGTDHAQGFPDALRGRCCAPLKGVPEPALDDLLRQAALVRLQSKAAQFHARARQAGWEQALWEGLLRALGYKHNVWPMQRVAELRGRLAAPCAAASVPLLQARLLGVAGLLPAEVTRAPAGTDRYLRGLWDFWWRERDALSDCILPRPVWRFHGLRPANHPQRRLALVGHWLAGEPPGTLLKTWLAEPASPRGGPAGLLRLLQAKSDPFWSWHWTLRSARLPKPQPLLGETRVTDLAVNAVLPWLWAQANEGGNGLLQREVERRYSEWPAAEDNALLRLARQRLLGTASKRLLHRAAAQQGLLQILRDFCQHSNALCEDCAFPALVESWRRQ